MQGQNVRYSTLVGLLAVVGGPCAALGQNALGDGRALERPLQTVPSAGGSRANIFARELLFRESIVSGTAPAGLSFRGDASPSRFEFRGELGEDSIFAYRRDSLYSGLAGRGIRGTEALQYQFALTTGGRIPTTLAGQLAFARAGDVEHGEDPFGTQVRQDLRVREQQGLRRAEPDEDLLMPAVEASSPLVQPVRSVSTYAANRSMQPTLVGVLQNKTTQQAAGQTASPLLGVQTVPIDLLRNPAQPQLNTPPPTLEQPGGTQPGAETPTGAPSTAYDQLLSRFQDLTALEPPTPGGETATGEAPRWATDIAAVRNLLRGLPPSTARALGIRPEAEPAAEGPEGLTSPADPDAPREPSPVTTYSDPEAFTADVYKRIREAGGLTDTLIAVEQPQLDRYAAYMQSAQELLAQERYFDAEERFISAMTSRPSDVNASVGRIHAQLGAGLFLSAGLNLRQLLVTHPEVAGMRYSARLLPSSSRLDDLEQILRGEIDRSSSGADAGLLLAYLGFQRQSPDRVRLGLEAMIEHGDGDDARLAEMLRAVWLDTGAPAADPSGGSGG